MEKREYTKRVVLEVIRAKVEVEGASKRKTTIRLYQADFKRLSGYGHTVDLDDIPAVVIDLEADTSGEVRLVSTSPRFDKEREADWIGLDEDTGRDKYEHPRFYEVAFDPKPKREKSEPDTRKVPRGFEFYWSEDKNKGLCRWHHDKELSYPVKDRRRLILENLGTDFIPTKDLAAAVGIDDPQNLRTEIGYIRKQIEKHLKVRRPNEMIESQGRFGYRIGKEYEIAEG